MKIQITEDLSNYLERLNYEVNSHKDLIAYGYLLGLNEDTNFKEYIDEYRDYYIEFEMAKKELENIYNIKNRKWTLDYASCILTIEEGYDAN